TNRDLAQEVRDKTFREDLYYRLNVFPIRLPALRDRQEDIPLLATYFAMRFAARLGKPIDGIAPDTLNSMLRYAWPGNICELKTIVWRAVILSQTRTLEVSPEMLPAVSIKPSSRSGELVSTELESVEREHIQAVLTKSKWVIEGARGAAQALGLHPNTLRSRM